MTSQQTVYLNIVSPKSRRRGAKVQYATFTQVEFLPVLLKAWGSLSKDEFLYPGSPSVFRTRWNNVLKRIGISVEHKLTPGSLRSGGAVAMHRAGIDIQTLLWRLRLQHLQTLGYYLQEVTASSLLPELPDDVRSNISLLQAALPAFVKAVARSAQLSAP